MSAIEADDVRARLLAGIALTVFAYFMFSVHDAAVKFLVAGYAVWQIMFIRATVILIGCLLRGGAQPFRDAARSRILKPMAVRSVLILTAWLLYYTAARDMQLAELTTLYFASPIMVTLMSIPLLGERVPANRWVAVIVGFAGVVIASNPTTLGLGLPHLMVLGAAFLWGLSVVLLRKTALGEPTLVQMIINNAYMAAAALPPTLYYWHTPGTGDALLLVGSAIAGGIAQFTLFEGMKRAPASTTAPFTYTSLVWAFVFGYAIWGEVPTLAVFAGAALVMSAGLIVIFAERPRKRLDA